MRKRDILRSDRGSGKLSGRAEREVRELDDPNHPRRNLTPFVELEVVDERVHLAADDEDRTQFDPDTHPKPPSSKEEAVTDVDGEPVDLMGDTPAVEVELGMEGFVGEQTDHVEDGHSITDLLKKP